MSEGVKIHRRCRLNSEILIEIFLSDKYLTDKAFAAGHIAVRLKIPAAHNMPLSLTYKLLYPFKKRRRKLADILIQGHLVVAEYVVKFICEVGGGTKG